MRKRKEFLSPAQLLDLITSKQWADLNDIYMISGKGKNASANDRNIIKEKIEAEGYKLPSGLLPMEIVVDYYKINISYLKKIASINNK